MAQRISPHTVAEEMLLLSSAGRGQQGMQTTSANPGPNAWNDSSGFSNPAASNNQDFVTQKLAVQNIEQNTLSAIPQAGAKVIGEAREGLTHESTKAYEAQRFANERLSELISVNAPAGKGLLELNRVMNSPERAAFENDIATGKLMAMGMNPDLAGA